jgi:Uma2 family endonuclease
MEMPSPLLVVEVASNTQESKQSRDRDYVEKRSEYAARRIPEYWIVDPNQNTVTVLALDGAEYREIGCFRESDRVISPLFSALQATAQEVLNAGM